MQLSKAAALPPAPASAAFRSQSITSRLKVFVVLLSLFVLLPLGPDELGDGLAHPANSIVAANNDTFAIIASRPQRFAQLDECCELSLVDRDLAVLRLIKTALGVEQVEIVDGAGVELCFSDVVGVLRFGHR
jgi:hypothetical protein